MQDYSLKTIASSPIPYVDYMTVDIRSILVEHQERGSNSASEILSMEIKDDRVNKKVHCSKRFMTSLMGIFGISKSTFDLFSLEEIVERIIAKGRGDRIRIALQNNSDDTFTALAAMRPTKPIIEAFDLHNLLRSDLDIPLEDISYQNGVVRSEHTPSILGQSELDVAGDGMVRRFVMDVPIDGYGQPSAYLQITRLVCSNGMIGEAPAFRSQVHLGDSQMVAGGNIVNDAIPTLKKFIESHNNDEGFSVLTDRMRTAARSTASLDEFNNAYRLLTGARMDSLRRDYKGEETPGVNSDVHKTLYDLAGKHLMEKFGLVNLDQISQRRRKLVPVECTVMDLINIASELSTHRAQTLEQRKAISAWIGQTLSQEFDLEEDSHQDYKGDDFYFRRPDDT